MHRTKLGSQSSRRSPESSSSQRDRPRRYRMPSKPCPPSAVCPCWDVRGESLVNFYSDVHLKGVTVIVAHALKPAPEHDSRPGFWTWMHDAVCFILVGKLIAEVSRSTGVFEALRVTKELSRGRMSTGIPDFGDRVSP